MDIDIPFTALNVWVKQLDQSWFNETAFVTLKSVFPLFYSPEEFNSSPLAENQIIPGDSQEDGSRAINSCRAGGTSASQPMKRARTVVLWPRNLTRIMTRRQSDP